MLAGMMRRPAAISSRICVAVRWGSRSATRCISGVMMPRRADSIWVIGVKPSVVITRRVAPRASVKVWTLAGVSSDASHGVVMISVDHPWGRKSHAVLVEGAGMPGVSGEEKVYGPPMSALCAKEPGVGASESVPGLNAPWMGSMKLEPSIAGPLWTVLKAAFMSEAVLYLVVSATALPAGEVIER